MSSAASFQHKATGNKIFKVGARKMFLTLLLSPALEYHSKSKQMTKCNAWCPKSLTVWAQTDLQLAFLSWLFCISPHLSLVFIIHVSFYLFIISKCVLHFFSYYSWATTCSSCNTHFSSVWGAYRHWMTNWTCWCIYFNFSRWDTFLLASTRLILPVSKVFSWYLYLPKYFSYLANCIFIFGFLFLIRRKGRF